MEPSQSRALKPPALKALPGECLKQGADAHLYLTCVTAAESWKGHRFCIFPGAGMPANRSLSRVRQ